MIRAPKPTACNKALCWRRSFPPCRSPGSKSCCSKHPISGPRKIPHAYSGPDAPFLMGAHAWSQKHPCHHPLPPLADVGCMHKVPEAHVEHACACFALLRDPDRLHFAAGLRFLVGLLPKYFFYGIDFCGGRKSRCASSLVAPPSEGQNKNASALPGPLKHGARRWRYEERPGTRI